MTEKILDNLMKEAGPIAIEEMTKEDLENLDKPVFEFSKEHEEKMQQLFDEVEKESLKKLKQEPKKVVSKPIKFLTWKKVLLVAAVLVLAFGLFISTSGAFRESFVKLFLDQKEEYSDVKNNKTYYEFYSENIFFGYIPIAYEIESEKKLTNQTMLSFENEYDNYILLYLRNKNFVPELNTEDGEIQEVVIAGKDMVYSESEEVKMLAWKEQEYLFTLYTNDSQEVLYKVAEHIKIVDNTSQK